MAPCSRIGKKIGQLVRPNAHVSVGNFITDQGLAGIKHYENLSELTLIDASRVGDEGIRRFLDCKHLQRLAVSHTRVTAAMIAEFHRRLPDCRIESDAGVMEPQARKTRED